MSEIEFIISTFREFYPSLKNERLRKAMAKACWLLSGQELDLIRMVGGASNDDL